LNQCLFVLIATLYVPIKSAASRPVARKARGQLKEVVDRLWSSLTGLATSLLAFLLNKICSCLILLPYICAELR